MIDFSLGSGQAVGDQCLQLEQAAGIERGQFGRREGQHIFVLRGQMAQVHATPPAITRDDVLLCRLLASYSSMSSTR